uniref:Uncharacterized protein n=1 Tax=Acrobeloides nanus TaxID=290746 RepID=A0A914EE53_9BILA
MGSKGLPSNIVLVREHVQTSKGHWVTLPNKKVREPIKKGPQHRQSYEDEAKAIMRSILKMLFNSNARLLERILPPVFFIGKLPDIGFTNMQKTGWRSEVYYGLTKMYQGRLSVFLSTKVPDSQDFVDVVVHEFIQVLAHHSTVLPRDFPEIAPFSGRSPG